jgi:septal ring-binding cell division protein DamX
MWNPEERMTKWPQTRQLLPSMLAFFLFGFLLIIFHTWIVFMPEWEGPRGPFARVVVPVRREPFPASAPAPVTPLASESHAPEEPHAPEPRVPEPRVPDALLAPVVFSPSAPIGRMETRQLEPDPTPRIPAVVIPAVMVIEEPVQTEIPVQHPTQKETSFSAIPPAPASPPRVRERESLERRFTLQVASCKEEASAQAIQRRLIAAGFEAETVPWTDRKTQRWYVVRSGSFVRAPEARAAASRLAIVTGLSAEVRSRPLPEKTKT